MTQTKRICPICEKEVKRMQDMAKHYDCFERELEIKIWNKAQEEAYDNVLNQLKEQYDTLNKD